MIKDLDRGWQKIKREVARAKTLEVAVGLLANSGNVDGVPIAEYATYNEYGTKQIPARPFMAISFEENLSAIGADFDKQGGLMATGKKSATGALTVIGVKHAQRIQKTITGRDILPRLADSTVAAKKGSSKTLVDTSAMVNAVQMSIRGRA